MLQLAAEAKPQASGVPKYRRASSTLCARAAFDDVERRDRAAVALPADGPARGACQLNVSPNVLSHASITGYSVQMRRVRSISLSERGDRARPREMIGRAGRPMWCSRGASMLPG